MTKPADSDVESTATEELSEAAQALVAKVQGLTASERTRLAILGRVVAQGDAETSLNRLDGSVDANRSVHSDHSVDSNRADASQKKSS